MTHTPHLAPLRDLTLSEKEKQYIRNNVLTWQRKSLFLRKIFFASRVTGYVAVSAFGIFVLISSYLPQQGVLAPENSPLFTLDSDALQGTVQADTIGRLLEIQWVVHVIQNGNIVPKTDIAAGEMVVLQPWAELIVQVRAATFAKITWPAKFVLEYIPEIEHTVLNLLEGKLIEVTTKITPLQEESQPQESSEPQNAVIIKTKFVEVTPPSDQTTSFVIEQEDKNAEVIAKSWTVFVKQLLTSTSPEDEQQLAVDAWNAAHIDTKWIALYVPETEDQAVLLALESKNLQIRYEAPEPTSSPESQKAITSLLEDSQDDLTLPQVDVEDDVLAELSKKTTQGNGKKVIDPDLLKSLNHTLNPSISSQNITQMQKRKDENINAYIIAYSNLLDQLNRAYTLLWVAQPATSTDSLEAGIQITQNLLTLLETSYSTPPSLRSSLQSIINGLVSLQQEHNVADEQPVIGEPGETDTDSWTVLEEPSTE